MLALTLAKMVSLSGGGPDKRITKLPMPTQKAMARPASRPSSAPCRRRSGALTLAPGEPEEPEADLLWS